jgi:hypothetical protein
MNRSRRDVWPPYEPTRHVLVKRQDHRYARPMQGFVVEWRRVGNEWEALVAFADETHAGAPVTVTWFPVEQLRPCRPDPNEPRDHGF